jgi:uncharacterized protein YfaS (alpha-2-macroglobulin family)
MNTQRSRFAFRGLLLLVMIALCGLWTKSTWATESLMLYPLEGARYSGELVGFGVQGDNLRQVTLRVYRIKGADGTNKNVRTQVAVQVVKSQTPRSELFFKVRIGAPGWYQAEARATGAKTAFDDVTFSVDKRPAKKRPVPTLYLEGLDKLNPPGLTHFEATGQLLQSAKLRVWKLAPGGGQHLVYEQWKPMPPLPPKKSKKYASYLPVIRWSAPLKSAGVYLIEAISDRNLKRLKYVRVSDIGLVSKRAPHELLVYAIRLSTGAPLANVAIRADDSGLYETRYRENGTPYQVTIRKPQPSRAARTDGDGVARFDNTPSNGVLALAASAPDGSRIYKHDAYIQDTAASDLKVFFYTERPIYRPGQTVQFKGIARRDLSHTGKRGPHGALFVPVKNAKIKLEVTDASNEKFATLELKTNSDGAFAGQVELADEAPVGRYAVETFLRPAGAQSDESFYNRFVVQEYRKPEFEVTMTPLLDAPFVIRGEPVKVLVRAKYFFGTPVKGAQLEYSGSESDTVKLDENGEAVITLPNFEPFLSDEEKRNLRNGDSDETLNLHAKVTDNANRIVESDTAIFSTYAQVRPTLGFDKSVYNVQDTTRITIKTRDPIGRAVSSKALVTIFYQRKTRFFNRETLQNQERVEEVPMFSQQVQTDGFGVATLSAKLGRAGYLRAEVEATDARGRTSRSDTHFWSLSRIQRADYYWGDYEFPNIAITPDKTIYRPGDTVRALLMANKDRGYALLTLQGDRVFWHRVVKLAGRVNVVEFKFPEVAAPGAHLVAGTSQGRQWSQDTAYLKAIAPEQALNISIKTNKDEYRPGATAEYSLLVKDGTGKPQRADVSLGLVDKAIYGLMRDETPDPLEFFYGSRENLVSTSWEFPGEVQGGSYQRIEQQVPVRRNFQDTAFWNPFVTTDADGKATLRVTLPDNLTTWRATARAFTNETKVGAVTDEILVTKPLLTRLIVPRFLTQADQVRAQVIVQNNMTQAQDVRVSLRGAGVSTHSVGAEAQGAQNRTIPAGSSASFYWMVGTDEIPANNVAHLVATARSGANATSEDSDALELKLPVQPRGFPVKKWANAVVREGGSTLSLAATPGAVPNASRLRIAVAPSVAGPMLGALPNLIRYPYGCTEQTLSRFVPAMVADRTLKTLKLPAPEAAKELPQIVKAARSTLYSYQHSDGGWGWWPDDNSDPYITAYAIYGLTLAKENGYDIERERIIKGLKALQSQFASSGSADGRAYMMLAYATAIDVWKVNVDKELGVAALDYPNAVYEFRNKLSNYGLASLALAHERIVRAGLGNRSAVNVAASYVLFADAAEYYLWRNDPRSRQKSYALLYSKEKQQWFWKNLKTGGTTFLTVPEGGIKVTEEQGELYSDFIGFGGSNDGSAFSQETMDAVKAEGKPAAPRKPIAKPDTVSETFKAHLQRLLDDLESRARREAGKNGEVASWSVGSSDGTDWNDSDIEASALALQALVRARPQSSLIQPAISWLFQSRRGTQWASTKDTAQVVIALCEYLKNSSELDPDETVKILVNGQEQSALHFTRDDIGKPDALIGIPNFNGDAQIEIQRSGRGVAYVAAELVSYETSTLATGAQKGFKVTRRYQVQNEKGRWRDVTGPLPSGVLVRVDLRVEVTRPYQYVLLEDFVPSGFEARPEDDNLAQIEEKKCDCENDVMMTVDPPVGWSPLPVARRESRDNRQAWFVTNLPFNQSGNNGKFYLRYILRPEQPGTRTAPPARIEAMYRPQFNGHSSAATLEVK